MLKTRIYVLDRAIAFQVHEQDLDVRTYLGKLGGSYTASNGWVITTSKVPELNVDNKIIALRGSDYRNELRVDRTWGLDSNRQRDRIVAEAELAIAEFKWSMKNNPGAVNFVILPAKATSKIVGTDTDGNTVVKPVVLG